MNLLLLVSDYGDFSTMMFKTLAIYLEKNIINLMITNKKLYYLNKKIITLPQNWNNMVNQIDKDKYEIIEINSDEQETGIDNLKKKFLIDSISVEGYPTIGSIQDHKFQPYTGNRDLKTLLEWVQNL